ncbi:MAG: hypothetical protein IKQ68_09220 [Prevotella sp.]|nr:hypothetical protein [Prevotella sp.]
MNKKKTLIYLGSIMIAVWVIACIHGILSTAHPHIDEGEAKRRQLSSFMIEGDIVSAKYLHSNHGYKHLITVRPTTIEIYKNGLSKTDSFWCIYDKKRNLVYLTFSYWDERIENEVWNNVKIDSWKEYDIEMTNGFKGNIVPYPEILVQYENENTIRL